MNHHRKEIAELIETTFRAIEARLREEHDRDLRESQSDARCTRNAAAILPAEADSYTRHIKSLTVARAQTIADAYTAFSESSGDASEKDLATYYNTVLSARRSAFQAQAGLVARRTGLSLGQLPGLLRRIGTDSHAALLEGRSILAKQRATLSNPRSVAPGVAGSDRNDDDRRFAMMAIEEAKKSIPEDDRPHPKVGAVVVKDGTVLAKAHRGESPKSHAEYIALEQRLAEDLIAGATVYTTLEPCTTRKHPKIPCAQRLVERRLARVLIGMLDPNPDIRGLGEQLLNDAGIETQLFPRDLRSQVEEMNRDFIRAQKQRQLRAGTGVSGVHGAGSTAITMEVQSAVFSKDKNGFILIVEFRSESHEPEQLTKWTLEFNKLRVVLQGVPGAANLLPGAPWFAVPPFDIPSRKVTRGAVFFSGFPNFMGKLPTEPATAILSAHLFPSVDRPQQSVDIYYIKTQVRNHQKLIFNGTASWPPTWREKNSGRSLRGELGTLMNLRKIPPQYEVPDYLVLESKFDDGDWVAELHADDREFLATVYEKLRSGSIGKSLGEIGSLEIP